ncbi:hypothetical protein HHI36_011394 [Cryptolaemus montrouzieri]|uniref:Uncharacterized protein n=1 Tax=Cryptolaemus montrouzieri TaxID=559131 RepID=A0ABD2MLN2_9CUCU
MNGEQKCCMEGSTQASAGGNSGSLTAHSPDYGFASSPPGVREAANALVTALQNTTARPTPDPHIVKALLDWIQQIQWTEPEL